MKPNCIWTSATFIFLMMSLLIRCDCHAAGPNSSIVPVLNVKLTYPQTASAEFGFAHLSNEASNHKFGGPFVTYEPGYNGQKLHLGYCMGSSRGSVPGDRHLTVGRLSLSYLRPWRTSSGLTKSDNYFGIELVGSYKIFLLSAGAYYSPDGERLTGSFGVGAGL